MRGVKENEPMRSEYKGKLVIDHLTKKVTKYDKFTPLKRRMVVSLFFYFYSSPTPTSIKSWEK